MIVHVESGYYLSKTTQAFIFYIAPACMRNPPPPHKHGSSISNNHNIAEHPVGYVEMLSQISSIVPMRILGTML